MSITMTKAKDARAVGAGPVPRNIAAYRCPRSGSPLYPDGAVLRTPDGKYRYRVEDGIPVFLAYTPSQSPRCSIDRVSSGEISEEDDIRKLDRLLTLSESLSCMDALRETYGGDSEMIRYVTRTPRFLDVVPLRGSDTVLEIGTGLGQFTPTIAARAGRLHALEVVEQQARFTRRRCEEAGAANVQVDCGGDDCRLPYRDGYFDVVIMNLVFEWCASRLSDESHPVGQARMLRELARVLKPGGLLYLATKNRYSLHYLAGRHDEHAFALPFGNALPRRLLHTVLRLTGRQRAAGYLYSHRGLRRLVEQSGFEEVAMYCPIPDPREPECYVRADDTSIAAARGESRLPLASGRLMRPLMNLMPTALVKHFTYGQVVLARTPRASSQDRLA